MATPHQNPLKPFRTWRLKNGVRNASVPELEVSAESCEYLGWLGGGLVVMAVVAEVALAIYHPSYDSMLDIWGSASADVLIGIGVAIEILLSRMSRNRTLELDRRSKDELKAAVADAAEAKLETEKIRQRTSPRVLTEEQYKALQTLKGQISEVNILSAPVYEAVQFARQITHALTSVGISVIPAGTISEMTYPGIAIVLPRSLKSDVQEPLVKAFRLAGISVVCGNSMELPSGPLWVQTRTIFVGEKQNPYPSPPYTAGLRTPKNPATATRQVAESDP